jgi:hypothetical protein
VGAVGDTSICLASSAFAVVEFAIRGCDVLFGGTTGAEPALSGPVVLLHARTPMSPRSPWPSPRTRDVGWHRPLRRANRPHEAVSRAERS